MVEAVTRVEAASRADADSWEATQRRSSPVEVLARVAQTVSGTASLDEALGFVVHATRDLLKANRATILLLDPTGLLVPAVSAAREQDPALYRRFRSMAPLTVSLTAQGRELLEDGRAVAIERAEESSLVPEQWRREFGLESLALVPLVALGEPCGVLVVDAPGPGQFSPEQMVILEGVAASASVAVRNARDYTAALERSTRLDRILAVAEALNGAPGVHRVTETALVALCEVFAGDSCSLNLLSQDHTAFTTLGACGAGQPGPGRHRLEEIDPAQLAQVRRRWAHDPTAAVVYDAGGVTRAFGPFARGDAPVCGVVLPLTQEGRVRGFAVVGRATAEVPNREQLQLCVSVVGQVWLALERARLTASLERRVAVAEVLHLLDEELVLVPDMRIVIERLAPAVRDATGGALLDAFLTDSSAARLFGAATPSGSLAGQVRTWRRSDTHEPVLIDDLVTVPMLLGRELIGLLRVRKVTDDLTAGDAAAFLLALAGGVAEAVARTLLRHRITDSERDLAVAEERERVGQDLHRTVGGVLAATADQLRVCCQQPGDVDTRDRVANALSLLTSARLQIRDTVQALSVMQLDQRGLAPALRELGRTLTGATGASVHVRVVGTPRPLPAVQESVLLRVAHEALAKVERHSRASVVSVGLQFSADRVELTIRDNGVGLFQRADSAELHSGLRAMQQRLGDLGGQLRLQPVQGLGLRLTATLPTPTTPRSTPAGTSQKPVPKQPNKPPRQLSQPADPPVPLAP